MSKLSINKTHFTDLFLLFAQTKNVLVDRIVLGRRSTIAQATCEWKSRENWDFQLLLSVRNETDDTSSERETAHVVFFFVKLIEQKFYSRLSTKKKCLRAVFMQKI